MAKFSLKELMGSCFQRPSSQQQHRHQNNETGIIPGNDFGTNSSGFPEETNLANASSNSGEHVNNSPEPTADYDLYADESGNPIYIVKQERGYLAILFSLTQTLVLAGMMYQCKIAPLAINPMVGPYPDALSYWGGKNAYFILYENEWWRMVTPIFLHAGVIHLVCNVAVQIDTGAFFEREWGSFIWLVIYLSSAIGGSVLSTIVVPNTVGVGSSGAVCGLFGAKLAEAFCRSCESQKTAQARIGHSVLMEQFGGVLCSVILIGLFSFIPFVDWAAHLGGLLSGFSVGIIIFSLRIKTFKWRLVWFIFGLTLSIVGFITTVSYMLEESHSHVAEELSDVCGYYMEFFDDYQCNCMLEQYVGN